MLWFTRVLSIQEKDALQHQLVSRCHPRMLLQGADRLLLHTVHQSDFYVKVSKLPPSLQAEVLGHG